MSSETLALPRALSRARPVAATVHAIVASLVGLTGLADMLSAFIPHNALRHWLAYWPLALDFDLRTLGVIVGLCLIMLARGLARGKRHAWQVTIGLLALSLAWQLTRGHVLVVVWLTGLIALLLGSAAPFFRSRSDPPSLWRGYTALIFGAMVIYLYALGGTLVLEHRFAPIESLEHISVGVDHLVNSIPLVRGHITTSARVELFSRTLALGAGGVLLYGLAEILRPAISRRQGGLAERARLIPLVRAWGANTVAAFALAPEKRYFFSDDGRGAVPYATAEGIAVMAGDPLAAPTDAPQVMDQFMEWCRLHDLGVAGWQVRDTCLGMYERLGLQSLKIGEEAIIDLPAFALRGGAMQNVRTTLRHAEKAGVTVRFFTGTVSDAALATQVHALSAAWVAGKGGREMGFSLGRWGDAYLADRLIAVATDAEGQPLAFATFVPVPGRQGWALDLMRRSPQSVAGTMELLLVRAIERLRDEGAQVLSLGLAPLANHNDEPVTNLGQLCAACSVRFGSTRQAASLTQFKRKFGPRWEARYLVYPRTLALPRVGLALLSVHLCRSWHSPAALRDLLRRHPAPPAAPPAPHTAAPVS